MIYALSKNEQKLSMESLKNFKISVHGTSNPETVNLKA